MSPRRTHTPVTGNTRPTPSERQRDEALDRLAKLERRRLEVESHISTEVANARYEGVSWREIGSMLGITKQAAQKRYDRRLF